MKSAFFNSVGKDRRYSAVDWAKYFKQFIGNGVFGQNSGNMMVVPSAGMVLNVNAGSCFINGYVGYCEGETVTLDVGGTSARVDMVAARLDLNARDIHIYVAKGDGTNAPAPSRNSTYYDLVLAYVSVGAGAAEITAANITDKRGDNSVCGWVVGIVDQIDTSALFAQYDARWDMLMAGFSGDEAEIIAAFNGLLTVKSINNIAPSSNGNLSLTLDDIPDGDTYKKTEKIIKCGTVTTAKEQIPYIANAGTGAEVTAYKTVSMAHITFDSPFSSPPIVCATCYDCMNPIDGSATVLYTDVPAVVVRDITANGFTVRTDTLHDPYTVHWIAMGV